jgi:hypothetical protein
MQSETQERKLCERRFERSQKSLCSPLGQNSIGLTGFDVKRSLRIAAADAGRSCPQRTPEPPRKYEALRALRGCRLERPAELVREIGKVD